MEELVTFAKVVSDINRVKIIALLLRDKEACVCELCDTLKLSQPLVSRHLKKMRELNILETQQSGKWIIYSLSKSQNAYLSCFLAQIKEQKYTLPSLVSCSYT